MMKAPRLTRYMFVPMAIALLFLSSFTIHHRNETVRGNGSIKEETRAQKVFKSVETSGDFSVYIDPTGKTDIRIEADDNLLPYIVTEVKGNSLGIYIKEGYNIKPTKPVKVYVSIADLEGLSSSGSGGFYSQGALKGNKVDLSFSGSVMVDLDLTASALKVGVSGSTKMNLKGGVPATNYAVSGSAKIDAGDLASDNVIVGISGSCKLEVFAQKKLNISVSGMGDIHYKGNPTISQSSSGMAKVSKID